MKSRLDRRTLLKGLLGGAAIDATGSALPDATLKLCQGAEAVLLGAVGGPRWDDPKAKVRPEQGLLAIRKGLGLYANLRPVAVNPALLGASTLRPEVLAGVLLTTTTGSTQTKATLAMPRNACRGSRENSLSVK